MILFFIHKSCLKVNPVLNLHSLSFSTVNIDERSRDNSFLYCKKFEVKVQLHEFRYF
jgi:hypothetical protein